MRTRGVAGVRREGPVLVIDSSEGVQARFVDAGTCEGFDTCRVWTYAGALRVTTEPYSLKRMLPEPVDWAGFAETKMDHVIHHVVEMHHGEGAEHWVVNGFDGTSVTLMDAPVVSPDGKMWAAGGCDELAGCRFELWRLGARGPLPVFRAAKESSCCEVVGWDGPDVVRVKRWVSSEAPSPPVRLEHVGAGWLIRASAGLKELQLAPVTD
jgi:hypothetical protein